MVCLKGDEERGGEEGKGGNDSLSPSPLLLPSPSQSQPHRLYHT